MTKIKSEKLTEVKVLKPKSYKVLKLSYDNLKEEYSKFIKETVKDGKEYERKINDISKRLEIQLKKNAGLERTIRKLKDQNTQLQRNISKTIKEWNKDKQNWTSQPDTPKETEKETKVGECEKRDTAPWMAVGC